jgi:hypothetical protein
LNNTDQKNTHVNQQLKIPLELNSTGSNFFPRGMIVHHEVVEQHGPEEYYVNQQLKIPLELNSTGAACSKLDF